MLTEIPSLTDGISRMGTARYLLAQLEGRFLPNWRLSGKFRQELTKFPSAGENADADWLADRAGAPHRLVGLVQELVGVVAVLGASDDAG